MLSVRRHITPTSRYWCSDAPVVVSIFRTQTLQRVGSAICIFSNNHSKSSKWQLPISFILKDISLYLLLLQLQAVLWLLWVDKIHY
jgi:hypothetical protein